MRTCVCVSEDKNCYFFRKFSARTEWMIPCVKYLFKDNYKDTITTYMNVRLVFFANFEQVFFNIVVKKCTENSA